MNQINKRNIKNIFKVCCVGVLALTSVQGVNAFTSNHFNRNVNHGINQIKWSQNYLSNLNNLKKGTDDYAVYGETLNNINNTTQYNKVTVLKQNNIKSNIWYFIKQENLNQSFSELSKKGKTLIMNIDVKITLPTGKSFTNASRINIGWDIRSPIGWQYGLLESEERLISLKNNQWQKINSIRLYPDGNSYGTSLFEFEFWDLPVGTTIEWRNLEIRELI